MFGMFEANSSADPTKVLDAFEKLVVSNRAGGEMAGTTASPDQECLRMAVRAAESAQLNAARGSVDHFLRAQSRGPSDARLLSIGEYQIELVPKGPLDAGEQVRVWRNQCLLADVQLPAAESRCEWIPVLEE